MSSQMTKYRSDGNGRDCYISDKITRPTHISNLNARRDCLPDNVFKYLKEQIHREQYQVYVDGRKRLGASVDTDGRGRRKLEIDAAAMQSEALMAQKEAKFMKQQKLMALYEAEFHMWQEELHERGLAIERDRA